MGHDLILVTGATGLLGARLMAALAAAGLPAVAAPSRADGGDLTRPGSVARLLDATGAQTVVHCAALVPNSALGYDDDSAAQASLSMVAQVLAARPARLVFTSSMTVYGATPPMPAYESDAPPPARGYAGAKRRAELAILESGIAATLLRLPGLFGLPRRNGLLYNAACAFARGDVPHVTADPPVWAAMHVDDAAHAVLRAATAPAGGVVNVGYDCPMGIDVTLPRLAEVMGRSFAAPAAPVFRMDVSRMLAQLGPLPAGLDDRLAQLAQTARGDISC